MMDALGLMPLVGVQTFIRGATYARQGAVEEVEFLPGRTGVRGLVEGGDLYTVSALVTRRANGTISRLVSSCTCPMGVNCKHVVALLVAAYDDEGDRLPARPAAAPPPVPAWRTALAPLLREDPVAGLTVGLQFSLAPTEGSTTLRLGMRPVLPGRRGRWVRSGISWSAPGHGTHGPNAPLRRHVELLIALAVLSQDSSYGSLRAHRADPWIFLEDVRSRDIWKLLTEAVTAGMPLINSDPAQSPVRLVTEPVRPTVELTGSGGDLTVRAGIAVDGRGYPAQRRLLLGSPTQHGVACWDGGPADADQRLVLAPLADTPAALRPLLAGRDLTVPAADVADFNREFLPALRRRMPVASPDGSVDLPVAHPPRLTAVARYQDGHRIRLTWHWNYRLGDEDQLRPFRSTGAGRDTTAESRILAGLDLPQPVCDRLSGGPANSGIAGELTFTGMAAAQFAETVLPVLAAHPDIDLVRLGEQVDYRRATADPVVAVTGREVPGDRDWFDLHVTVTVEDEPVPFDLLLTALAEGRHELILPSGTWFGLDREHFTELRSLIEEARALVDTGADTVRVSRWSVSLFQELERLGIVDDQAAAWRQALTTLAPATDLPPPAIPPGLRADLRPYQRTGFGWLSHLWRHGLGGILADDMGLGKTVQTLALISQATPGSGPFLVVAPTSVVSNWQSEARRFTPDRTVVTVRASGKRRGAPLAELVTGADLVITSYALFRLDFAEYERLDWAALVLDEAQFVKNHQSQAFRCAKKLPAPVKFAITGTPLENNLMELWSLLSITAPGLFPDPRRFAEYYRTPIESGGDTDRLDQLRRRIRPLMLRRTKEEVAPELPPKQEQVLQLDLEPAHRRLYRTHLNRERQKVLGLLDDLDRNRFEVLRSLTLLRRLALDASLIDEANAGIGSAKLDAMMELISDAAAEGHRTLVFSQFTGFLGRARERLAAAGFGHCYLDGTTRDRAAVLERFRTGDDPVFLISLKAGGFGLNLTEADYVILLDPWWNPATEAQAIDRTHRIGQRRTVMVYRLIARDTIEEKVMALKEAKAELLRNVLADGEAGSGVFTAADIRELLV